MAQKGFYAAAKQMLLLPEAERQIRLINHFEKQEASVETSGLVRRKQNAARKARSARASRSMALSPLSLKGAQGNVKATMEFLAAVISVKNSGDFLEKARARSVQRLKHVLAFRDLGGDLLCPEIKGVQEKEARQIMALDETREDCLFKVKDYTECARLLIKERGCRVHRLVRGAKRTWAAEMLAAKKDTSFLSSGSARQARRDAIKDNRSIAQKARMAEAVYSRYAAKPGL